MAAIWREIGADQARAIRTNEWLTDVHIEELKRKVLSSSANSEGGREIAQNNILYWGK